MGSCVVAWWGACSALKFQVTGSMRHGASSMGPAQQVLPGCRLVHV